jgi:hypothetical protein
VLPMEGGRVSRRWVLCLHVLLHPFMFAVKWLATFGTCCMCATLRPEPSLWNGGFQYPVLNTPNLCDWLLQEGECFAKAASLDTHKALVHIFFAQRSTKKVKGITDAGPCPWGEHTGCWRHQARCLWGP